nr:hypothetical protein [uncultured Mediterranean phage uvMED]
MPLGSARFGLLGAVARGSLKLIETQTASNVATLDFTSIEESTYDAHLLVYKNAIPIDDGKRLAMRLYESGTLETASVYSTVHAFHRGQGTVSEIKAVNVDYIRLGVNVNTDVSGESDNGYAYIYHAGDSNKFTSITSHHAGTYYADSSYTTEFGGAMLPQASTVDGIRLYMFNSGNIQSVTASLYGIQA